MLRASWLVAGLMLAATASCVQTNSVSCGDDKFCPAGSTCAGDRCLRPEQLAACLDLVEEADCFIDQAPGTCRGGACELWFCGDGYLNGAEACDSTDLGGKSCIDAGFYEATGLACTSICTFEVGACTGGECGDDIINGPELCDGATDKTCVSIGFDGGTVGCDDTCGLTIRDCSRFGWNPEALNNVVALAVGGASAADHWAVGTDGRANRYEGAFWNPWPTNVTNDLIAVWGIATNNVWVVGRGDSSANPAVLLQFNGAAWNKVMGVPAADYVDLWAANANAVFVATTANGILTWNGTQWSELGTLNKKAIAIRGSNANDVWVATETSLLSGELMHWNGTQWSPSTLTNAKIRFLDVNAPNDVWALGHDSASPSNGVIAHFDGTAWTTWRAAGEIYNNIASSAPNDAWVATAGGNMRHFDGVGWVDTTSIAQSPTGTAAISGLVSFSAIEVVAVSTLNLAYRYRGQAFGRFESLPFPDPFAATQNSAMWGSGATNMWTATVKGEVFHYTGTAWNLALMIDPLGTVGATSIWGSSASDVWVSAQDGRVFQYNGSTWAEHSVSPLVALTKLWGSGPNNLWAFGLSGAFHWDGSTWTNHTLSGTHVLGAEGSGPDDIYAVTLPDLNGDALWRWNGTRWAPVPRTGPTPFVTTTRLNNVVAITPNLVFVVADNGHIHRWDGATWTDDVVEATADLQFLSGSATDDVIAASERELFHWDDRQWSAMRPPIDFVPNTMDYLPMADLLVTPGRIDMLLHKYRIRTLLRTRPLKCRPKEIACFDGVDDDCNGFVDSTDSECN